MAGAAAGAAAAGSGPPLLGFEALEPVAVAAGAEGTGAVAAGPGPGAELEATPLAVELHGGCGSLWRTDRARSEGR